LCRACPLLGDDRAAIDRVPDLLGQLTHTAVPSVPLRAGSQAPLKSEVPGWRSDRRFPPLPARDGTRRSVAFAIHGRVHHRGVFPVLCAHPLPLASQALSLMDASSAGHCWDRCHPSEVPVPAVPAVLAQEIGLNPVRHNLKGVVPTMRTGQLPPQEVDLRIHCVSFLGSVQRSSKR
jgi:hypothetical protein